MHLIHNLMNVKYLLDPIFPIDLLTPLFANLVRT